MIRLFFKTLRALLGPFMLVWERIQRPTPVKRTPQAQALVDRQCADMLLYQFNTCPFCIKVRQEIHRLALPIARRDAQHNTEHRATLLAKTGATKVPCLRILDTSGNEQWLTESSAIINYLRSRFTPASGG